MKIIDEKLLSTFRGPGPCEWCLKPCQRREPHHIICRGSGSGKRLDLRLNLVALGTAFDCLCHTMATRNELKPADFFVVVSVREEIPPDDIETLLRWLIRLDKRPTPCQLETAMAELSPELQAVARGVREIRQILEVAA